MKQKESAYGCPEVHGIFRYEGRSGKFRQFSIKGRLMNGITGTLRIPVWLGIPEVLTLKRGFGVLLAAASDERKKRTKGVENGKGRRKNTKNVR